MLEVRCRLLKHLVTRRHAICVIQMSLVTLFGQALTKVSQMNVQQILSRIGINLLLLSSLTACTVVPSYPSYSSGYAVRPAPVYVETYGSGYYGQPRGNAYYQGNSEHRREHYREEPRQDFRREAPRQEAPHRIPSPLEVHRDVRRSLGLPRLPGMP